MSFIKEFWEFLKVRKKYWLLPIIIVLYSSMMSALSLFGKYENMFLKNLIIIPILGQMIHFYLDSQLWKFSEKHNRDNTLLHLKKIV